MRFVCKRDEQGSARLGRQLRQVGFLARSPLWLWFIPGIRAGWPAGAMSTWDNCLVLYAVGPDASDAAADLLGEIAPEMRARWNASEPRDWANESFAIAEAVSTGYCVMQEARCAPPGGSVTVSREYLEANQPIVREQLKKADVRLARVLDAAFGN